MANQWFRFKQFTVRQEKTAMKVGTDGVLLGAWAGNDEDAVKILDVGTGTGLVALMLAQRFPRAQVDAVELDPLAASQAEENFRSSPWSGRLRAIHRSFQEFAATRKKKYDLIVSNPPYFSHSLKNPSTEKIVARHDDSLPKEDLLKHTSCLLTREGAFCVILPTGVEQAFTCLAENYGLFPGRILRVKPVPGKPAARTLICFQRKPVTVSAGEMTIETGGRHRYSSEYKALTGDFYLAF